MVTRPSKLGLPSPHLRYSHENGTPVCLKRLLRGALMVHDSGENTMPGITPCLWYDDQAEEAARFYTSIFQDSKIKHVARYSESGAAASGRPAGSVMTVLFELQGQEFMALNGGPMFKFSEAVSFMVMCENQEEVERYWKALSEGGQEGPCGWLKDKFGLSWQIVPAILSEMMQDKDPQKPQRVMKAILGMQKLDVAALKRAYDG
jgi:predicted 3-demethylubiquinone-9 3-methyltransferase (glyoxalase superfamily)